MKKLKLQPSPASIESDILQSSELFIKIFYASLDPVSSLFKILYIKLHLFAGNNLIVKIIF